MGNSMGSEPTGKSKDDDTGMFCPYLEPNPEDQEPERRDIKILAPRPLSIKQRIEQEKRKKVLISSFKLKYERKKLEKNLKKLSDRVRYLKKRRRQQNQDEIVNNIARCTT